MFSLSDNIYKEHIATGYSDSIRLQQLFGLTLIGLTKAPVYVHLDDSI